MPSGYKKSDNTDLDAVFAARGSLTARANVGIKVGTQDLADRYAKVADGTAADADTGFKIADGTDLRYVFAKTGSLVFEYAIPSGYYTVGQNLWTLINNAGYAGQASVVVTIGSQVYLNHGLNTGAFTVPMTIINNGEIYGISGTYGAAVSANGTFAEAQNGNPGSDGGHALTIYGSSTCTIVNNGVIKGGGGGGGSGATGGSYDDPWPQTSGRGGRGSGGVGSVFIGRWEAGFPATGVEPNPAYPIPPSGGATAGANGGDSPSYAAAGGGGAGGDHGQAGGAGGSNTEIGTSGGAGGAAGKAIHVVSGTFSLTNNGTIVGATS